MPLLSLCLAACSSSGGGSQPDLDTWEGRLSVVEAAKETIDATLPDPDKPPAERDLLAELDAAAQALSELPGVEMTVVWPDAMSVQIVLVDATSMVFNHHLFERLPQEESNASPSPAPPASVLPSAPRAVVHAFDGGGPQAAEVEALVSRGGYQTTLLGNSIDDLSNFQDIGFVYLDTHGVAFTRYSLDDDGAVLPGQNAFGLMTSTALFKGGEEYQSVRDLVLDGSLLVALDVADDGQAVAKYAITDKFVSRHWRLDGATVIIAACASGNGPVVPSDETTELRTCYGECQSSGDWYMDPTPLRESIIDAGAASLWTNTGYTNAVWALPSYRFIVERMLGINEQYPLEPPARPFDHRQVYTALVEAGLDTYEMHRYTFAGVGVDPTPGINTIVLDEQDGAQAMLAPSIEAVTFDDDPTETTTQATVTGLFGENAGSATLGGVDVSIRSWAPEQVVVALPHSHSGALVLEAPAGVESNRVPITEWRGPMRIDLELAPGAVATLDLDLIFRADLHGHRPRLGAPIEQPDRTAYLLSRSTGVSSASGVHVDGDTRQELGGRYELSFQSNSFVDVMMTAGVRPLDALSHLGARIDLDPEAGTGRLCLWAVGEYDMDYTDLSSGQSTTFQLFNSLPPEAGDSTAGALPCFDLSLSGAGSGDYSLRGGSKILQYGDGEYAISWGPFEASHPPDNDTPR